MKYTIQAIPTEYNGRRFRSRLEARWAAMFDLLGWRYEYEPYDLGSWSPDFLLSGLSKREILVEVKPLGFDDPGTGITEKMAVCANSVAFTGDLLLLRAAPEIDITSHTILGWIDDGSNGSYGDFWGAPFCLPPNRCPKYDFCHFRDKLGRISGELAEEDDQGFLCVGNSSRTISLGFKKSRQPGDALMRLWAKAGNEVQWHDRGRP